MITFTLAVRNGLRALAFYEAAFKATVVFRIDDECGAVVARLAAHGSEFWVADESPDHQNFAPATLGGSSVRLLLIVDNPETVFRQAIDAGATCVSPLATQHGWKIGRMVDPFGHHWEIGCEID